MTFWYKSCFVLFPTFWRNWTGLWVNAAVAPCADVVHACHSFLPQTWFQSASASPLTAENALTIILP